MKLHTASEMISFTRLLENESAEFYDGLISQGKFTEDLRGFVRENRRNVVLIQQAYNNIISDALESGFAFDIEADDFRLDLPKSGPFNEVIKASVEMETRLAMLYSLAYKQAQSLLPDVARIMKLIAQKRQIRIEKLSVLSA